MKQHDASGETIAPVLMVQGTASSVGKSVITAGLCRVLRRRGYRVAPFKAQNMSLNAAVTADGGEIARSTAVQAAAAGLEPTVDMNPILLKPEAAVRSQVIVRGKVWGTYGGREYFERKVDFWPYVADALDRLRRDYEVVVAEGAGSPAEVNLRDREIVNMRVARHADAAVVLVGDIYRGGVFAQLLGTIDLLLPEERRLVVGTIVNQFAGDPTLFADGVRFLEERSGLPVFGVVPKVRDLGLAEEDAVPLGEAHPGRADGLVIAVLRLPHISNFDDFDPLAREPGVALRYVDRAAALADADLIAIPGSKSTVADLAYLRERGIDRAIADARGRGAAILGVCGGYQMLGRWIHDPERVESPTGDAPGLGLLAHETVFVREKRTSRVRGRVVATRGPMAGAAGADVTGYEIHAGRTRVPDDAAPLLRLTHRSDEPVDEADGDASEDGLVFGTYLHGLFDNPPVVAALLAWLRTRRPSRAAAGDAPGPATAAAVDPYDRWADVLESSLDVSLLLARAGIPPPRGSGR